MIQGTVRLGRRTKDLVKRLRADEIAVIDHADLDRLAAEDLAATGCRAVINVARSVSDRYPNAGPLVLVESGVTLVDAPGADLFESLRDGEPVTVDDGEVRTNGSVLCSGEVLTLDHLRGQLERQRDRIDQAIAAFAENTMTHVRREEGSWSRGRSSFRDTRRRSAAAT